MLVPLPRAQAEVVGEQPGQRVDAEGEVQPLGDAAVLRPGVDADQVALLVVQAAAAVAGVEGRLRLDDAQAAAAGLLDAELRDRALRVRPAQALRVADG